MDLIRPVPAAPPRLAGTTRAFLGAGAACGLIFGLVDGIAAALRGPALSIFALAGCLAAAVFQYGLGMLLALGLGGILLHPFLGKRTAGARYLVALRIGLALGLFAEIYWWTRPYVFYGRSSLSTPRLLASAGMLAVAAAAAWFLGKAVAHAPARAKRGAAVL